MSPFDRAIGIVTEFEAAGETSAARMLLLTRIEDLCEVAEAARFLVAALTMAWPRLDARAVGQDEGRGQHAPA